MDKVTDRILWSVLVLAIGVSLFVFFKPAAAKIVHNSVDIENIKNKDDTPLTDVTYFGASGVISSPKAGVYDFNTYAVPLSQDLQRQCNHGDGVGFGYEPLKHEKGYLYDFSYDIVLLKGQIVTLGGHNAYRDADSRFLVNGQELPLISTGDTDLCALVNAPNGLVVGQKYHVDEIFRVNNTNYDTAVYIQPNRPETANHDFQAEVSNVKFDKYVVK